MKKLRRTSRTVVVFHRARDIGMHGPSDAFMVPVVRFGVDEEASVQRILENVFFQTNHVMDDWTGHDQPWETIKSRMLLENPPYRSTSVGDVVLVNHKNIDTYYRCEPAGWQAIPKSEVNLDGDRHRTHST